MVVSTRFTALVQSVLFGLLNWMIILVKAWRYIAVNPPYQHRSVDRGHGRLFP